MGCVSQKQQSCKQNHQVQNSLSNPEQQSTIFSSSKIVGVHIKESTLMSFILNHIIQNQKIKFKLIFRASDNNYDAMKFHEICQNITPTLLLAVTNEKRVFGGYTTCLWQDNKFYKYEIDKQATSCLFRISSESSSFYTLKKSQNQKAIMNHKFEGPIFGQGHDLIIKNECHKNECWSNLGKSYQCGHRFTSNRANKQLTNTLRFFVEEYEIWTIQNQ